MNACRACLVVVGLAIARVLPGWSALAAEPAPPSSSNWARLRPDVLKRPVPVDIRRNPLQPANATAGALPVASGAPKGVADRLGALVRSNLQGVLRVPGRPPALLWSGRLVEVGREIGRVGEGPSGVSLCLKTVGETRLTAMARPLAPDGAGPFEVETELPPLFRLR